jgi:hypothetical protein
MDKQRCSLVSLACVVLAPRSTSLARPDSLRLIVPVGWRWRRIRLCRPPHHRGIERLQPTDGRLYEMLHVRQFGEE